MQCGVHLPIELHRSQPFFARSRVRVAARSHRTHTIVAAVGPQDRKPWDISKFLSTVWFFNKPKLELPQLSTLFASPSTTDLPTVQRLDGTPVARPSDNVVLVAGATGGVGKRVVERLLAQGKDVRALIRDIDKARQLLSSADRAHPGRLEVVMADITQPKTLSAAFLGGVKGVVCATAVRVQPKEGDSVDRKKYYQGVKFYDPEIVGDTPETVEYKGVLNLLKAVAPKLGTEQGVTLYAASGPGGEAVGQDQWGDLSDPVMGGVSESMFIRDSTGGEGGEPTGVFRGNVSTANNGGFCSVRTRNFSPPVDASAYDAISLRLKGDGQRYKLFVRTDPGWDAIAYAASFDTKPGEWQTIVLPFSAFKAIFRAKTVQNAPPLDASRIYSLQLMLSKFEYDGDLNPNFKGDGTFELPVESIKAVPHSQPTVAKWVHISSAGVTRPNRPGINVDVEPPAVKLNDVLGGLLTYKLAGEDAVRESGIPFTIIRPVALTEEPFGAPLEVDQGDVIKGKISREEIADLAAFSLSDPVTKNKVFEIKSTIPFSTPFTLPEGVEVQPRNWHGFLEPLREGVTGRTVGGVYTGNVPEADALKAAKSEPAAAGKK